MCTGTIFLAISQDNYEIQNEKLCTATGHLTTKGNFGVLNSSKNDFEIVDFCSILLGQKFFVPFLEDLKTPNVF